DYAIDVHIDTGAFGLSKSGLLSVVQDIFIAPVWGALEWVVHALLVALELCYALELLGGAMGVATAALAHAREGFTDPWLALVLSLASLLALYHGLVRRRVAETLGGALTTLAMMAGGLWVIADPAGTVGAVGDWANQASLGTLAATASGSPDSAAATLGDSMRALYAAAIETPWCYLEFGNVRWCGDPALLEPRLRAAALALAAREGGGTAHNAELVRSATTNGQLFLAFAANGPARNSINLEGSLLRTICRSEDATKCSGPAAAEAEFRTAGGTLPRVLGLLAIAAGVAGMAMLFGLLALRLLAAAFLSLLLLLLAPFAVLAPALGDGGRAVFAGWFTRLLGAVVSKLMFSFVLGALLTMQRMLVALDLLGWWTQWLLVSSFWWIVFLKRHEAAAILRGADARGRRGQASAGEAGRSGSAGRSPGRRSERPLQTYGALRHPRRWARARVSSRLAPAALPAEERRGHPGAGAPEHSKATSELARTGQGAEKPDDPTDRLGLAGRGASSAADKRVAGGAEVEGARELAAPLVVHERQVAAKRAQRPGRATPVNAPALDAAADPPAGQSERRSMPAVSVDPPAVAEPTGLDRSRSAAPTGLPARSARVPDAASSTSVSPPSGAAIRPASPASASAGAPTSRSALLGWSGPSASSARAEGAGSETERSPIMRDAFAVAERRKRQLGFGAEP
ncbi:MAG TPA: hypothetical protein VMS02_03985, partial [Solirubrobacteraceae bacterium]|nr:hypothetical protein [Solirubrobacteraceae bacterium]